jgi:hypothetical protein
MEALVLKSPSIIGKAGRYISWDSGPKAIIIPNAKMRVMLMVCAGRGAVAAGPALGCVDIPVFLLSPEQ